MQKDMELSVLYSSLISAITPAIKYCGNVLNIIKTNAVLGKNSGVHAFFKYNFLIILKIIV
jgi:hypothetical protein